jgi:hypothetical protein
MDNQPETMPSLEFLRVLVRPADVLDEWSPSFGLSLAVVALVALVCAVGVGLSAGFAAEHVDGTIRIDNPERPPDWVCEQRDSFEGDSAFRDGSCDQPEQVSFALGPFAHRVVMGQAWVAFAAVLLSWPVAAGFFHALAWGREAAGFGRTLSYTAWGFLPAVLRYAALPFAFDSALADWPVPQARDPLEAGLLGLLADPAIGWFSMLVLVTLAWQAYVFTEAVRAARGVERGHAATVVAVPTLVSGAFTLGRIGLGFGTAEAAPAALVLVATGLAPLLAPYAIVMFDIQTDLIGTRGGENVEPAPWRVRLTRLAGVGFTAAGVAMLGGAGLVL